jgi:DNA-binding CsgD family transcriptional regulator
MKPTKREIEVAYYTAFGYIEKEIAEEMFISIETVKQHKKRLSRKIGAHNIADITRWYFEKATGIDLKKQVIALSLLALMLFAEFINSDFLRPRRTRGRRIEDVRRTKRTRENERSYFISA